MWPPEVHTFWPLTIHSSPSCIALVCRPARSEPAPGSLNSWHQRLLAGDDVADVALDLLGRAVGGDRRRGEQQTEAAGCAERAELGDRVRRRHGVAARQAPAVGVRRAASAPTSRRGRGAPTTRATVRSGSQFSSSQARTSSTTSLLVEAGRSVVSVIATASPIGPTESVPNAPV